MPALLVRGLVGSVLVVACLAAAGAIYNIAASASDRRRFPPPGVLIETHGVRLHLQCVGSGSPTVVFESGLGVPALGWSLVWPGVAEFTRACAYDRAGYGYSEPHDDVPRTSAQAAAELHALLGNAGVAPPYVLVGHSLGGHHARVFTAAHPEEVSGVVLVDASHEDMAMRLPDMARDSLRTQERVFRMGAWASRLGLLRLWPSLPGFDEELRNLPPDTLATLTFLTLQIKALRAAAGEAKSLGESAAQARAAGGLGDRPLAVLASGRHVGVRSVEATEFRRVWTEELQPALSRLSTRGRLIILDKSGHMIPFEQPQAVVDAVHEVVTTIRDLSIGRGLTPCSTRGPDEAGGC